MTMRKLLGPFSLLVLLLVSVGAQAQQYYVDVTNQTGYTIIYLYVSPVSSNSWEEDVLGNDVIPTGHTQRVNLYGYNNPVFDIKAVDEDGDSYTFRGINVATQDITVTLGDID